MSKTKTDEIITAHSNEGGGLVERIQYGLSLPDGSERWGNPLDRNAVTVPELCHSNDKSNGRTTYYIDPDHRGAYNLALLRDSYRKLRTEIGMATDLDDAQAGLVLLKRKIVVVVTTAEEA